MAIRVLTCPSGCVANWLWYKKQVGYLQIDPGGEWSFAGPSEEEHGYLVCEACGFEMPDAEAPEELQEVLIE